MKISIHVKWTSIFSNIILLLRNWTKYNCINLARHAQKKEEDQIDDEIQPIARQ